MPRLGISPPRTTTTCRVVLSDHLAQRYGSFYIARLVEEGKQFAASDFNGQSGNQTTETQRYTDPFLLPFMGKGVIKHYSVSVKTFRCYLSTTDATYYHRIYVRAGYFKWNNLPLFLEDFNLAAEHEDYPAASAGWYNYDDPKDFTKKDLNGAFDGIPFLWFKFTSWASVTAINGQGVAQRNNPEVWDILATLELGG